MLIALRNLKMENAHTLVLSTKKVAYCALVLMKAALYVWG